MDTEKNLQTAESILAPWTKQTNNPDANRLDVIVEAADLITAINALQQADWGYLAAITGLDLGPEAGKMEVLYHFCEGAAVVTLRVTLDRETAVVPTVCGLIPSAGFFERELSEMFGITVEGTPNSDRLFLPDEWPDGVYPLRKDFQPIGN
ncbi:MAG: NADH-quinone oxidoreductase subunit C [Candidatus Promineifilaceae bacterium]